MPENQDYIEEGYDIEELKKQVDRLVMFALALFLSAPYVFIQLGWLPREGFLWYYGLIAIMFFGSYLIVKYGSIGLAGLVSKGFVLFSIFGGLIRLYEHNWIKLALEVLSAFVWWFYGPLIIWILAQCVGFILYHLGFKP